MVNVRGTDLAAGGLAGRNFGSITTNYITGKVSGNENVGGLVGSNPGNLSNCYSTCMVSGTGARVGGLVGSGGGSKSFWDIETSGQTTSAGGTGLTTAEMMDLEMLGLLMDLLTIPTGFSMRIATILTWPAKEPSEI